MASTDIDDDTTNARPKRSIGVPANQLAQNPVGRDFTRPGASSDVLAAIQGGTQPGQYTRLGLDNTSQIYGTSSKPGSRMDTFVGVGTPDPNNPSTKVGQDAITLAGLGTLPGTSSARPTTYQQGAIASSLGSLPAGYSVGDTYNRAPGAYDPTSSSSDYASDLASIASRDPRSVLGRAAWNAHVDDVWNKSTGKRAPSLADPPASALAMFNARNQAGNENARDQTMFADQANKGLASLAGIDTKGQYGLDAAQIRADAIQNRPNFQVGADGTLYRLSDASATPVTGADGNPLVPIWPTPSPNSCGSWVQKLRARNRQYRMQLWDRQAFLRVASVNLRAITPSVFLAPTRMRFELRRPYVHSRRSSAGMRSAKCSPSGSVRWMPPIRHSTSTASCSTGRTRRITSRTSMPSKRARRFATSSAGNGHALVTIRRRACSAAGTSAARFRSNEPSRPWVNVLGGRIEFRKFCEEFLDCWWWSSLQSRRKLR